MDRRSPHSGELIFPFGDGGCFGCSPTNPAGLHLHFYRGGDNGDEIVSTYTVPERFHGAPGIAHGGIIATILDEFSCAAAVFLAGSRVVTGELKVRYDRPCPVEVELVVKARVTDTSHARYLVIEAWVERDGTKLAGSTGRFFRHDG